ncbi:D-alanyl-D-alanine carboxypeptidase family protein [Candidatus Omnitrophota bacterium]
MFKRLLLIPLLFLNISGPLKEAPSITAESAILMDPWTKKILYSKNPHQRLPPASTIKIMTALTVLKNSYLKKKVIVSKFASSMEPSKVHIKEGEIYFIEDLLKALLLNSGNDASVALAESVAGSERDFVEMMDKMVKRVGAKNTNLKNSSGLPIEGQYSTAYDLSLVVREAMKDKNFVDIMKTRRSEIEELTKGKGIKLKNHNKSLWEDTPYLLLGKTGYTRDAKHCFAGYIKYNRWHKVIVVVLKSKMLWKDLEALQEVVN